MVLPQRAKPTGLFQYFIFQDQMGVGKVVDRESYFIISFFLSRVSLLSLTGLAGLRVRAREIPVSGASFNIFVSLGTGLERRS